MSMVMKTLTTAQEENKDVKGKKKKTKDEEGAEEEELESKPI